jgi:hypothetical protein
MTFLSSFCPLEMIPLCLQIPARICIIFSGVFHARKDLGLGPKYGNLLCSLPVSASKTLVKNDPFFGRIFGTQISIMFWVEFGVENRPKKESFGVDFTSRGKHIPKQEDMFGLPVQGGY